MEFKLDNGLRVVHRQDASTGMVALNLLYNTGARDEDPQLTGMAHLIEHLMFSGSAHVADFDAELQRAGGRSNAWTASDFTCFYNLIPAVNVETAFRVESDRMLQPAITQRNLDIQRSVVIEEFKQQCLNRPYGDLSHYLNSLAFKRHPYRWPVIGLTPEHLERITLNDVTSFYDHHYSPSNAVLAVTGNITADECGYLCEKWMGDIPARPVASRALPAEVPGTAEERMVAYGKAPLTAITIAYPMEGYGSDQYFAADALTDVLSNGPSSRFERRLPGEGDTLVELDASILGSEDPGLLMISARLANLDEATEQRAIHIIDEEIDRMLAGGVTEHELQRSQNKYESQYLFSNLHYARLANTLAMATMHGEQPDSAVRRYRSLTTSDLHHAARSIFNHDHRKVLIYRNKEA